MFPLDIFTQAFEGNWVAWFGIAVFLVAFAAFVFIFILWWKLPDFAKKGFLNNVYGHRPVVVECYENKTVRFQIPQVLRGGISYQKGAWYIPSRLWAGSLKELQAAERQAMNAVYTGNGCPAGLFFNYSVQAQVINPELLMIVEHEEQIKRLQKGEPIRIKKELFMAALEHVKDGVIQLKPMNLDFPLDIRAMKAILPHSLSKSQLLEQENQVREDMRAKMQGLSGGSMLVVVLVIINIVVGVIGLLKGFGMI